MQGGDDKREAGREKKRKPFKA
jgi:hypothetical protein